MKPSGIITLTTDFGLCDPYVGAMKGVILSVNSEARVVDITHQIKPGSITHASSLLKEVYGYFSEGTIHLAVIDPGVGTERRPILVETKSHIFVGPDNGLFWPIIKSHPHTRIIHINESRYFLANVSSTFHGRDVFAPVAAHLSRGASPGDMGPIISDPVALGVSGPRRVKDHLVGQVIRIDHFGNIITDIPKEDLDEFLGGDIPAIKIGSLSVKGLNKTYSQAGAGQALALIGSSGCLEIAVNLGRADDRLGIQMEDVFTMDVEVGRIKRDMRAQNSDKK